MNRNQSFKKQKFFINRSKFSIRENVLDSLKMREGTSLEFQGALMEIKPSDLMYSRTLM